MGDGLEFGTFSSAIPGKIINSLSNTDNGSYIRTKTDGLEPATVFGTEVVVDPDGSSTYGRFCIVRKDDLGTQTISMVPQQVAEGNGGTIESGSGILSLRTAGDYNLRLGRNSIIQLELQDDRIEASNHIIPAASNTYDLAESATPFRNAYFDNNVVISSTATTGTRLAVTNTPGSASSPICISATNAVNAIGPAVQINSNAVGANVNQVALDINIGSAYVTTVTPTGSFVDVDYNPRASISGVITDNKVVMDISYNPTLDGGSITSTCQLLHINANVTDGSITTTGSTGAAYIETGTAWRSPALTVSHGGTTAAATSVAVRITGADESTAIEMTDGDTVGVSAANEGRLRYNTTTQTFQVSENAGDWAALVSGTTGKILQLVSHQRNDYDTGSTVTPLDNTIPSAIEGDEFLTATITLNNAANLILCIADVFVTKSGGTTGDVTMHLHSGSGAAFAVRHRTSHFDWVHPMVLVQTLTPGGVGPYTISCRIGAPDSATLRFNGDAATGALFLTSFKSGLYLLEVEA